MTVLGHFYCATPTDGNQAANRSYVDAHAGGTDLTTISNQFLLQDGSVTNFIHLGFHYNDRYFDEDGSIGGTGWTWVNGFSSQGDITVDAGLGYSIVIRPGDIANAIIFDDPILSVSDLTIATINDGHGGCLGTFYDETAFNNRKPFMCADPIIDEHAATKGYVDAADALKFDKAGGVIPGNVEVNGVIGTLAAEEIQLTGGATSINMHRNIVKIYSDTGVCNITTLTAPKAGTYTIIFMYILSTSDTITLIHDNQSFPGVNEMKLKDGANFVGTDYDTITLAYDGYSWYETGRSVN